MIQLFTGTFAVRDSVRDRGVEGSNPFAPTTSDQENRPSIDGHRRLKAFFVGDSNYQFVFAKNVGHGDRPVKMQTLPEALEWLWEGTRGAKCEVRDAII